MGDQRSPLVRPSSQVQGEVNRSPRAQVIEQSPKATVVSRISFLTFQTSDFVAPRRIHRRVAVRPVITSGPCLARSVQFCQPLTIRHPTDNGSIPVIFGRVPGKQAGFQPRRSRAYSRRPGSLLATAELHDSY